ncbi:TRAP transporter substrate-binding protein DctP [Ferrovibrio sp. MS7]|uniref:TRAP transporter substrate-binding protein DctP n=1 Tax=Ferrovibrio plantarum TaxID=3119164 RepID=UPI0031354C16
MSMHTTRRRFLAGTAQATMLAAGLAGFPAIVSREAQAQAKPKLRFSAVFSEQDIRAEMMKKFAEGVAGDFVFEGYYGGNLFKQGTELVALQRGNLEMGNIAPQDISKQIPAWSILTAAYLFRDADHLAKFFASPAGAEMKAMTEDKLGVRILGPTYFGARQVGLKPNKKINTPADLAGIKLRMPPGEAWQFLGESLGANPTAMAYAEVYTGLQTGAIDAQDNPLPNVENMKFYEVMSQIVMTSHLVGFDLLTVSNKVWTGMNAAQQKNFQAAADSAIDFSTKKHQSREKELVEFFKSKGVQVYEPDQAAFRKHAQQKYLASDLAKDWPKGMLDRINAL